MITNASSILESLKHLPVQVARPSLNGGSLTGLKDAIQSLDPLPPNTLVVINDSDRSTPTAQVVHILRKENKLPRKVTFLVATGTHTPPSLEQAKILSGAGPADRIIVHNARDERALEDIGTTQRGTRVRVNKALIQASHIFTITSVEPHYFAGFTGGPKSFIPGVAAFDTIVQNHRWAITPDVALLLTWGNPLWEDLWEGANLVRPLLEITSLHLVHHGAHILYATAGPLPQAFEASIKEAQRAFSVELQNPADHVISVVAPPLDQSLYQAQKAMENARRALCPGGTFTLVASCTQGIGNSQFFNRLAQFGSPKAITQALTFDQYQFGDHKAYRWATLAQSTHLQYVGKLPARDVQIAFMKKLSAEQLLEQVRTQLKAGARIVVDPAGGYTALHVK